MGVCIGLQKVYAQMREIDGAKNWRDGKLNLLGEFEDRSVVPPGVSLIHFIIWKFILIELTKVGLQGSCFSQDAVLAAAAQRVQKRIAVAEMECRKVELKAKARKTVPDYTKIRKWIKGIGEIVDGRIKIYEQVLQFVNKDYG